MTFRSRLGTGLLTMLVVFAMASISFAQVQVSLNTTPSSNEIQTNKAAQTGDPTSIGAGIVVSGALLANSALTTTTLRITYPSPITSSTTVPTNDPIKIVDPIGVFAAAVISTVDTTNSRVDITLPGTTNNTQSGSFKLQGVRIDANGKSGTQTISASLNNSANNYILTTTSATIISNLDAGMTAGIGARSGQTSKGTATILTNRVFSQNPDASLILGETFATAFRTSTQASSSGVAVSNGTNILLTFNNVPTGVTLTVTTNAPSTLTASLSSTTITSASNKTTLTFSATSTSQMETMELDITVSNVTSTAAVTTPGAITVSATFAPVGDVLTTTGVIQPTQANGYPVFTDADVGPVTVVNIISSSTTMLLSLAEKIGAFDTGISIANTTADPFGGTAGAATPQAGTITFDFFPNSGSACSLTTSATARPGTGLESDGTLAAGRTYVVLLSQLLSASSCAAGDFTGYIFITTNFLNAHGAGTISDFTSYSLAAPMMVLPPPAGNARIPNNGVESLGF